ncbi:hypothetical protein LDENG_00094800 [Lucifuga dentata]|nr:hypothetical protein LDENG_00094800 [Lucifuga dentata]
MAVQGIFTIAQIFSPSWTVFTILYFLRGLGQNSRYNRVEEAEAIVRRAAKQNKVKAPRVIFKTYKADETETESETKERYNLFDLVKISHIRATTLIFCFLWFTLSICYYGLSLHSTQLHPNPYISCFISAAIEVPAYVSSWLAMKHFPRQLSMIGIMLLGGVPLYFLQLVPQSLPGLSIALEMLGKFSITAGFVMIYVYTAEVYPTGLRSTAVGICGMVSKVGSCTAPFFLELRQFNNHLPYITLGSLAVLCAASILFLPESFRQALPETLQQVQKRKMWICSGKL